MATRTAIFIDDFDLSGSSVGLIVEDVIGHRGVPSTRYASARVSGTPGNVPTIGSLEVGPRVINVTGVVEQATNALLKTALDELFGRLTQPVDILVRFVDGSDRFVTARLVVSTLPVTPPRFTQRKQRVQFQLRADNPTLTETLPTTTAFNTITEMPLGSAISLPLIVLAGAVTNPVVTYRDNNGKIITTTGVTVVVAGGEDLLIDSERFIIALATAAATGTLTLTANAADGDTVTIGRKVYTFQTVLTDVDGHVFIGAAATNSLDNLIDAINLGAGAGVDYAASTTLHPDVSAVAGAGDTMDVTAKIQGTDGNEIVTAETVTGSWGATTLTGGAQTNQIDNLSSGGFIELDPKHGDPFLAVPTFGTLEVSPAAAGSSAVYRKRYIG